MARLLLATALLLVALAASARHHRSHPYRHAAIEYLHQFGYLKTKSPSHSELRTALETFQDLAALQPSGELDTATVEEMKKPRCGNPDVTPRKHSGRKPRFLYRAKWENKMTADNTLTLKWFIATYTKDIPQQEIKNTIRKSFDVWTQQIALDSQENIKLVFEEAYSEEDADVVILWARGDHGDPFDFDDGGSANRQTNVLAHTFYPSYHSPNRLNGDIHLDDFEKWTTDPEAEGANLMDVVTHEIGHTLGLGHSRKEAALMYPIYRKNSNQLNIDDKCAVNWTYIGASNFCMFIWLMAEIIPLKTQDYPEYPEDGDEDMDAGELRTFADDRRLAFMKETLKNSNIPLCRDTNYNKHHFERLLVRKLHFPHQEAVEYSSVVCNFFEGLAKVFGRLDNDVDIEGIYRNTVHEYQPAERTSYERMVRRELRRRVDSRKHDTLTAFKTDFFDERFFDGLLRKML
uniref:ZnMc domain-containing protein n=1 Tax=Steinernema glaseri TaxID=37863 RepID=A0A1I7Y249_9BILA